MKTQLLPFLLKHALGVTVIILCLTVIVYAQSQTDNSNQVTWQTIVSIVGWISIALSALASAAAVVYGVIKKQDRQQLVEARDNYKSLAESYKEKMVAAQLENKDLKAEKKELEEDFEGLTKKIARQ